MLIKPHNACVLGLMMLAIAQAVAVGDDTVSGDTADSSTVEFKPASTANAKQMSVVVTGVGTDAGKAKYNALSNAIEQVVGVLVDAETLVENDKLVREKVLTYTEGDIASMKVLEQWQKDGLYHIRLKATVAVQKIESRLREQHVAVREVDGEVFYDNAKRQLENTKNFSEMLAKRLRDFGAEKMVKPEIVGKPEVVGQNDQFATMSVKVTTKPDMENWKMFSADMLRLLRNERRIMKDSFVVQGEGRNSGSGSNTGLFNVGLPHEVDRRMEKMDGNEHGHWILFLQGYNEGKRANTMQTQWTVHRVDKSIGPIIAELEKQRYRLRVTLLSSDNILIAEDERELKSSFMFDNDFHSVCHGGNDDLDTYFFAPFLWHRSEYCPALPTRDFRISVPLNNLSDVAKVKATIEPIREQEK